MYKNHLVVFNITTVTTRIDDHILTYIDYKRGQYFMLMLKRTAIKLKIA